MGSSSRSSEATPRRSPAGHDDPVPTFFSSLPPSRPSPPVVVSSVPCAIRSGNSIFHFDPSDGSVRRTPANDWGTDLLNQFFGTSQPTADSAGPWLFSSSSNTVTVGPERTDESRRAAPTGEGCRQRRSTKMSSGDMSTGGRNNPSKSGTGSSFGVTSAPTPPCPSPDQNNQSDVQVEEEEEVLQESKLLLGMPQNPHYCPIRHHPKHLRHHLIAGYDKSFVEAGRKIQKLTATELERSKEDLRGTLTELDKMGYDVGPLARRLDALDEAAGEATKDACAARVKIEEASRKMEEKKVELRELNGEIKRLQIRAEEKQEGIQELEKWARELEGGLPDVDGIVARMAQTPLMA